MCFMSSVEFTESFATGLLGFTCNNLILLHHSTEYSTSYDIGVKQVAASQSCEIPDFKDTKILPKSQFIQLLDAFSSQIVSVLMCVKSSYWGAHVYRPPSRAPHEVSGIIPPGKTLTVISDIQVRVFLLRVNQVSSPVDMRYIHLIDKLLDRMFLGLAVKPLGLGLFWSVFIHPGDCIQGHYVQGRRIMSVNQNSEEWRF